MTKLFYPAWAEWPRVCWRLKTSWEVPWTCSSLPCWWCWPPSAPPGQSPSWSEPAGSLRIRGSRCSKRGSRATCRHGYYASAAVRVDKNTSLHNDKANANLHLIKHKLFATMTHRKSYTKSPTDGAACTREGFMYWVYYYNLWKETFNQKLPFQRPL